MIRIEIMKLDGAGEKFYPLVAEDGKREWEIELMPNKVGDKIQIMLEAFKVIDVEVIRVTDLYRTQDRPEDGPIPLLWVKEVEI
jgi:hypothetical protein